MRYKYFLPFIMSIVLFSCKREEVIIPLTPPVLPGAPVPAVLLKEITIPLLPSPYYHFEYDTTGKVSLLSFASGFTMYDFLYSGSKLTEMRNNIFVNNDRLMYTYDNEGRVRTINYADSNGIVFTKVLFTYDGTKLIALERQKKSGPDFIVNKTMTFMYYDDGNLRQVSTHRPLLNGVPELDQIDQFEDYDDKLNVDGFSMLHSEFFDHMVFLPKVQLQKNNPRKLIHTGNDVNYRIDYTYVYNDKNAPLQKIGTGHWFSGPNAGQLFDSDSFYSYY